MVKKPSELINGPQSPASSQTVGSGNGLTTLIVVALACVLGYLSLTRIDWGDRDRKQDDHHEQKDDKKQVAAKPGYLHIVRERIDSVEANETVARVAAFVAKQREQQVDIGWRDVDKDDTSDAVQKMIQHAKAKGVDPPFLLYKSKENVLGSVIKLPPSNATDAQIMEVFK